MIEKLPEVTANNFISHNINNTKYVDNNISTEQRLINLEYKINEIIEFLNELS